MGDVAISCNSLVFEIATTSLRTGFAMTHDGEFSQKVDRTEKLWNDWTSFYATAAWVLAAR